MKKLHNIGLTLLLSTFSSFGQDADTLAAISAAMDNPVGELIIMQNQIDYYNIDFPGLGVDEGATSTKIIPTFPISLTENWNLINRIIISYNSVPINKEAGDLVGFSIDQILADNNLNNKLQNLASDPFDRTSGFGDITYLGLIAPKKPTKTENGTFLWGIGPTMMFDTAEEDVLGLGANSAGIGALAAFLTEKWRFGVLPMQFWSYDENRGRSEVNYMNMQYFAFYAPDPTLAIGMSPYITANWDTDSYTVPVGLGFNKTLFLGPLPVRVGFEAHYNVVTPDDTAHSEWSCRAFIIPVAPAPGSELSKFLKQKQQ